MPALGISGCTHVLKICVTARIALIHTTAQEFLIILLLGNSIYDSFIVPFYHTTTFRCAIFAVK